MLEFSLRRAARIKSLRPQACALRDSFSSTFADPSQNSNPSITRNVAEANSVGAELHRAR